MYRMNITHYLIQQNPKNSNLCDEFVAINLILPLFKIKCGIFEQKKIKNLFEFHSRKKSFPH